MTRVCSALRCWSVIAVVSLCAAGAAGSEMFDLKTDWSETANPNGRWSYLEGSNPLPHVDAWQRVLGGWSTFQPGWARSEDGSNRLPFWFQSNGTETFSNDSEPGDIVVHTTDGSNGAGSGLARVQWKSPGPGTVTIFGAVWMVRDIGRGNTWRLLSGETVLKSGVIQSGDAYSRANPFLLADGDGSVSIFERPIGCNENIVLEFERTTVAGDFVGIDLTIIYTRGTCVGDLSGDLQANTTDLTGLLGQFGQSGSNLCGDLNDDGTINTADLVLFLGRFGTGCVAP